MSPLGLAREEMLGWVSHEIKSPLSTAVNATQLAMRSIGRADDPGKAVQLLERTMRQLRRIDELVNTLLDAASSRTESSSSRGGASISWELVEMAGAYWRDTHPDRTFEVVVPRGVIEIDGDRARLRQIIDNLVSNAVKYGQETPIVLEVTSHAGTAIVAVTDGGRGIPAEAIPQIFDRFHRVPGGRRVVVHGLGLFIAAALARIHGGSVSVRSRSGMVPPSRSSCRLRWPDRRAVIPSPKASRVRRSS